MALAQSPAVRYHVVELAEIPAPSGCVPTAINDNGDVVGYCDAGSFNSFAVVWRRGAVDDLGKWQARSTFSHASAINASGQIVGDGDDGDLKQKALVRVGTQWVDIDNSGGSYQFAYGITQDGVIFGNFSTQGSPGTEDWDAAYWTLDAKSGKYVRTALFKPSGGPVNPISGAFVNAANSIGIAVGDVVSDLIGNRAGLWKNDPAHSLVVLDNLAGFVSATGRGVSDDGRAVGAMFGTAQHAVLWGNDDAHTPLDLGTLPGDVVSIANGVNSVGQAVGISIDAVSVGHTRGFLYLNGTMMALTTLVNPADGAWTIDEAVGINNAGQIIGVGTLGGVRKPIVLMPVPFVCSAISVAIPQPPAAVGAGFSASVAASGGTAPYSYLLDAGAVPGLTLSADGLFAGMPTAAGDFPVTISATDANGCSGSAAATVHIDQGTPALSWSSPTPIAFGTALGAAQLNATSSVPGSFVYSPAAGTVLAAGAGQVLSASFTPDDAANYQSATVTVTIDVGPASQTITFGALANKTYGDAPFAVSATGGASGHAVTFAASGACTIAGSTVTITGAGSCTVTASQAGDGNYSAAADVPQSFSVAQAAQTIAFGALANKTYGDAPFAVSATGGASGNAVTFAASGSCSVAGGLVTIGGAGNCTITASQAGDGNYSAAADVPQSFSVAQAAQTIAFGALANKTYGDAPFAVSATGGASGNAVTFAASGACTIAGGTVTLTGAGNCTVTASQAGNGNYTAAADVPRSFSIAKASSAVHWAAPASITFGTPLGAAQLNATSNAPGSFVYSPAAGTVLGAGDHTLSVTFTPTDASISEAGASVLLHVNQAVPAITWPTPADITEGTALGAAQLNATANVPGSFTYSPAAGTVLAVGSGQTLSVTFTPQDGANYTPSTASVLINVDAVTPPPGDNILAPIADQQNAERDRVELRLQVAGFTGRHDDEFENRDIRFRATNLPAGLELENEKGVIKGRIRRGAAGQYNVTVTFIVKGTRYSRSFVWTVTP